MIEFVVQCDSNLCHFGGTSAHCSSPSWTLTAVCRGGRVDTSRNAMFGVLFPLAALAGAGSEPRESFKQVIDKIDGTVGHFNAQLEALAPSPASPSSLLERAPTSDEVCPSEHLFSWAFPEFAWRNLRNLCEGDVAPQTPPNFRFGFVTIGRWSHSCVVLRLELRVEGEEGCGGRVE